MSAMQCPQCGHAGEAEDFIDIDSETDYMFATCPECGHADLDEEFH